MKIITFRAGESGGVLVGVGGGVVEVGSTSPGVGLGLGVFRAPGVEFCGASVTVAAGVSV